MTDYSRLAANPALLNITSPAFQNKAEWAYERLAKYITRFQDKLDDEHEIGAYVANFPNGVVHFYDISYWGPDIITFYGKTQNNEDVQLIQHLSQLNVTLIAVKKLGEVATRIGFDIPESTEE